MNIRMKKTSAFFGGFSLSAFSWIKRGHVVVITLLVCLFWVCGVKAQPSALKAGATPKGNERAEVLNSSLQCRETGLEKGVNITRPRSDSGVDGAKLGKDGGAECLGSGGKSYVSLDGKSTENGDKRAQNDKQTGGSVLKVLEHAVYNLLIGFLIACIPLGATLMQKPNVKADAPRSGRG